MDTTIIEVTQGADKGLQVYITNDQPLLVKCLASMMQRDDSFTITVFTTLAVYCEHNNIDINAPLMQAIKAVQTLPLTMDKKHSRPGQLARRRK